MTISDLEQVYKAHIGTSHAEALSAVFQEGVKFADHHFKLREIALHKKIDALQDQYDSLNKHLAAKIRGKGGV